MDHLIRKLERFGVSAFELENHDDIVKKIEERTCLSYRKNDFLINDIGYHDIPEYTASGKLTVNLVRAVLAIEESAVFVMNENQIEDMLKAFASTLFVLEIGKDEIVENIELAMFWLHEHIEDSELRLGFLRPKDMISNCIVAFK